MNNTYERLGEIQKKLKAPKNQHNNFGNYNYRSLEDIVEAVKPLLEAGESIMFSDEVVNVGTKNYVKATAIFRTPEGAIQTHAFAREDEERKGMSASQLTGSCSSYARKYAAGGLFACDDQKDADAHKPETEAPKVETIQGEVDEILIIPQQVDRSDFKGKTWFHVTDIEGAKYSSDVVEVGHKAQLALREKKKIKAQVVKTNTGKLRILKVEVIQ